MANRSDAFLRLELAATAVMDASRDGRSPSQAVGVMSGEKKSSPGDKDDKQNKQDKEDKKDDELAAAAKDSEKGKDKETAMFQTPPHRLRKRKCLADSPVHSPPSAPMKRPARR